MKKLMRVVLTFSFLSTAISTIAETPRALAANLIIASEGPTAESFAPDGTNLGFFATNGGFVNGLTGLAFDQLGNLYAGDSTAVRKFSPSLTDLGDFANAVVDGGLAFDAAGNLYTADVFNNLVEMISPTGVDLGIFESIRSPEGIAFDKAGNLYVADFADGHIERYSPDGSDLGMFGVPLFLPFGIAFDATGNLYVSSGQYGAIERFSATGIDLGTFATPPPFRSQGLAFDSNGNLFVGSANAIHEFGPNGTDLGTFAHTFNIVEYLAVAPSPVPEPSTACLLFAACAVAATCSFVRQRSSFIVHRSSFVIAA